MISIRSETPTDRDAIRRVITDAFMASAFGHNGEAQLVDQLRSHCDETLSLVAVEGNEVVGHVFFSPVCLRVGSSSKIGMGLAPMAVVPQRQNKGIGTALVTAGLERLTASGCPYVVVLGHPQYYPRFGFQPAEEHGILHGFAGIPQDVFFIKMLDRNLIDRVRGAEVVFRREFGPQHDSYQRHETSHPDLDHGQRES